MNVSLVPLANVDAVWPHIAAGVARSIKKNPSEMSPGEYWGMCRSGAGFLILALDGDNIEAITIWRFSGIGYFECLLIEGRRREKWFKPLLDCALQISADHGLKGIAGIGRPGWFKILKKHFPQAKTPRLMYTVDLER